MEVEIQKADLGDKKTLENLVQFYMYDFTEFTGVNLDDDGRFGAMPDFDAYWTSGELYQPFLIKANNKTAGFVFVKNYDSKTARRHVLEHFFVLKKYRSQGVGRRAASCIFRRSPGEWGLSQLENNLPAQQFWIKVITELTSGSFRDEYRNGRRIQTFTL
ncbi:putative acetyltransferase [Paenibacillus forsythiae]|uniref:Acetyltransferase n=1 Tax=Paenibacillus forsythiae TaxID=365616 RepID=A0ABU3HDS9_9BACL|nr:GNAT family N-acetyltransferase [Paenibacillus forsythiae]MDT3428966.1 putative acetyltransferase [Paenibacillus forsythiae]